MNISGTGNSDWHCPACTYINAIPSGGIRICEICGYREPLRPANDSRKAKKNDVPAVSSRTPLRKDEYSCSSCHASCHSSDMSCLSCNRGLFNSRFLPKDAYPRPALPPVYGSPRGGMPAISGRDVPAGRIADSGPYSFVCAATVREPLNESDTSTAEEQANDNDQSSQEEEVALITRNCPVCTYTSVNRVYCEMCGTLLTEDGNDNIVYGVKGKNTSKPKTIWAGETEQQKKIREMREKAKENQRLAAEGLQKSAEQIARKAEWSRMLEQAKRPSQSRRTQELRERIMREHTELLKYDHQIREGPGDSSSVHVLRPRQPPPIKSKRDTTSLYRNPPENKKGFSLLEAGEDSPDSDSQTDELSIDDLSKESKAMKQNSLTLKQPVGRPSKPTVPSKSTKSILTDATKGKGKKSTKRKGSLSNPWKSTPHGSLNDEEQEQIGERPPKTPHGASTEPLWERPPKTPHGASTEPSWKRPPKTPHGASTEPSWERPPCIHREVSTTEKNSHQKTPLADNPKTRSNPQRFNPVTGDRSSQKNPPAKTIKQSPGAKTVSGKKNSWKDRSTTLSAADRSIDPSACDDEESSRKTSSVKDDVALKKLRDRASSTASSAGGMWGASELPNANSTASSAGGSPNGSTLSILRQSDIDLALAMPPKAPPPPPPAQREPARDCVPSPIPFFSGYPGFQQMSETGDGSYPLHVPPLGQSLDFGMIPGILPPEPVMPAPECLPPVPSFPPIVAPQRQIEADISGLSSGLNASLVGFGQQRNLQEALGGVQQNAGLTGIHTDTVQNGLFSDVIEALLRGIEAGNNVSDILNQPELKRTIAGGNLETQPLERAPYSSSPLACLETQPATNSMDRFNMYPIFPLAPPPHRPPPPQVPPRPPPPPPPIGDPGFYHWNGGQRQHPEILR